jgi:phage tail protein X
MLYHNMNKNNLYEFICYKHIGRILGIVARGGAVVEALCYKPEGRGIDSGWCHWNFSLT